MPSLRPLSIIAGLLALGLPRAYAAAAPIQSHQSAGITADIESVASTPREIIAQVTLHNDTKTRLYVTDARYDATQKASLGSGDHLGAPALAGILFCNDSASRCKRDKDNNTTENMTYVEPGDKLTFSMSYAVRTAASSDETISFSLALIARAAKTSSASESVGPAKEVRFSFSSLPIVQR